MTTEHTLVVEQIDRIAEGVVTVQLAPSNGVGLPAWTPGAHIDIIMGEDLERQYSLCGDPAEKGYLRVAVLREPESRGGSQWVHDSLIAGDQIRVRGPRNHFALVDDAQEYLFIAGGIGITPILPMLAACDARGVEWRLVYGGRTKESMAFLDTLAQYGDRVTVWPQDTHGHIDIESFLGIPREGVAIYCCGPAPLLDAVEERCANWPSGTLHVERFRAREGVLDEPGTAFDVILDHSDLTLRVEPGESIVDVVRAAGVNVPTSCREGTCGTCETDVLEGTPDHRDSFLSSEERESNEMMMVCCSRSLSPTLVLDL